MDARKIEVGETVRVSCPGVRLWNIPATVSTALVTEDNRDALIEDITDQITHGGATLEVIAA